MHLNLVQPTIVEKCFQSFDHAEFAVSGCMVTQHSCLQVAIFACVTPAVPFPRAVSVFISFSSGKEWVRASQPFFFRLLGSTAAPVPSPQQQAPVSVLAHTEHLREAPELCVLSAAFRSSDSGTVVDIYMAVVSASLGLSG